MLSREYFIESEDKIVFHCKDSKSCLHLLQLLRSYGFIWDAGGSMDGIIKTFINHSADICTYKFFIMGDNVKCNVNSIIPRGSKIIDYSILRAKHIISEHVR